MKGKGYMNFNGNRTTPLITLTARHFLQTVIITLVISREIFSISFDSGDVREENMLF